MKRRLEQRLADLAAIKMELEDSRLLAVLDEIMEECHLRISALESKQGKLDSTSSATTIDEMLERWRRKREGSE